MKPRVFFYVQHLLGIGHVFRALRIAHGLRDAGFTVDLVLGGVPVAGMDTTGLKVIQLPPLKAGPLGFSELVTATGAPADESVKVGRVAQLLEAFAQRRPDVVLIEAFPFGRRQMRFELIPLLEAAHARSPRPRIFASIRDILQETSKPGRARETIDVLQRYFDGVIVHGDPRLVRLDATFPLAGEIAPLLHYSGIVAPETPGSVAPFPDAADVVISVGGGAVGAGMIEAAIASKPLTSLASARWLVLTGPYAETAAFDRLEGLASAAGVRIERFVPDLAAAFAQSKLSVSQAGYNTVADILIAKCKAVLVPFARGRETEQTRRAALLRERGIAVLLAEDDLNPASLAMAIDQATALPAPAIPIELDGVAKTARILAERIGFA